MSNINLIGEWSLKSFTLKKESEGRASDWRGHPSTGMLIYTSSGHMAVSINSSKSSDSKEEKFDNTLFYSGKYSLQNGEIHHRVVNASDPDRIGKNLVRELIAHSEDEIELIGN